MKKFAMALALVLALSSVAMATDITTSGRVRFLSEDLGADPIVWKNDYRLQFTGAPSDNATITVRFEGDKNAPVALKRANYAVTSDFGKVVVGLQSDDVTGIQYNAFGEYLNATFTGVSFYPTISDDVKAFGFYNPADKQFGAQAKGTVAGVTVWGGVSKEAEDDMKLSVGGSYAIGEAATVYGQFDKQGDTDEKYIGANGTAAGIDWVVEYKLEDKVLALDFTKAFAGVEFNGGYEKDSDEDEGTLYFGTTVNF